MQVVKLVGGNSFRFDHINDCIAPLNMRLVNHVTPLARLESIWHPKLSEENCIRTTGLLEHITLSFLIGCAAKSMFRVIQWVKVQEIENGNDLIMLGLCTGNLLQWKHVIVSLIRQPNTNELGQVLIGELDRLGYSGIFADYKRTMKGGNLLLEYRG